MSAMPALFAGSMALSSVANAFTQMQAGRLNRSISRFNADMAQIKARDARRRGQQEMARHGMGVAQMKGMQRAVLAAQGHDVSALDTTAEQILDDTQYWGTIDRITIENNALREAYGFENEAAAQRASGDAARRQARTQAIGTITGGVAQSAMTYYQTRER